MLANKVLNLCFPNENLKIFLYDNPVADLVYTKFKHLAHIPIEFNDTDIYFNHNVVNFDTASRQIVQYANQLGIYVNAIHLKDQDYLNHLHRLYEEGFDGEHKWLQFHEHIHILEAILYNRIRPIISIDYRTKAGKLEENFDRNYLQHADVVVRKNQCFVQWQELGKTPYQYFVNNEPNDVNRLCQLAKPWLTLKPSIHVACRQINFLDDADLESFDSWFANYKNEWTSFWNIKDWNSQEAFAVIPIGEIESADILVDKLKQNQMPLRITQ